jgi:transposase
MRSIVRRVTGKSYQAFLTRLAKASGIETPTRDDLARLDRTRKKKTPNKDWTNPYDPDAKVTKMKDGRTHLAHKAEHAVDLEIGAIVAVTLAGRRQRRHHDDRRNGDGCGEASRRRAGRRPGPATARRDHRG